MRVILTVNLQKYDKNLVVGSIGTLTHGLSNLGDRFCKVLFDNGSRSIDVLYESLKPIQDEKYLERYQAREVERNRQLAAAKNVFVVRNSKGEFKYFEYCFIDQEGVLNGCYEHDLTSAKEIKFEVDVFHRSSSNEILLLPVLRRLDTKVRES